MNFRQQTTHYNSGTDDSQCRLKFVNFEAHENHRSHETQGLSEKHLVVRRGKPFRLTLMFCGRSWNPRTENLILEIWIGGLSKRIPVQFSDERSDPQCWSAKTYPGDRRSQSVTIHVCSPVQSSVAQYRLLVHIETTRYRRSYTVGTFVLLCNPWLKDDPVYMPRDAQIQEYIKSDYGLVYMGTHLNINERPWSFGQYEPGVLEACLALLQVSPQHLRDKDTDYVRRADPVYLSRVICAMVNSNDDLGVLEGKWQGSYEGGVNPTEWSGSADILHRWVSSNCSPVRYGQCWVFASVLCTVMRVLGIPSRVVTVFNAAHDGDGNLKIHEFYTSTGEKLKHKDSIWNFHVWVECWMRRPDLGAGFDGWQVVDPTPQEKSAGIYCCGPCPVVAIQRRCLRAPYDTSFIYASVDADVIRLIVRDGRVVDRKEDTKSVGQLIYTKSIGSDAPENLTQTYKGKNKGQPAVYRSSYCAGTQRSAATPMCMLSVSRMRSASMVGEEDGQPAVNRSSYCAGTQRSAATPMCMSSALGASLVGEEDGQPAVYRNSNCAGTQRSAATPMCMSSALGASLVGEEDGQPAVNRSSYCAGTQRSAATPMCMSSGESSPGLEVSLIIDRVPILGESIVMSVTVTNQSSSPRVLMEHLNAQLKGYSSNPEESFWKTHKEVRIEPGEDLTLHHTILHSEYESVLASDAIVNVAVVIKDVMTEERFLDTQEINISSPQITIEIEGGDSIQMKKEHTVQVSFTNTFTKTLNGALLTVEGSGLLQCKHEAKLVLLQPGEKIEKTVSIVATSPGTKVLMATFSHSKSPGVLSRSFHKVSVVTA